MSLKATDFSTLNPNEKKKLLEKKEIMTEFGSTLDPKKSIKIQSIDNKTSQDYTIYGWEPAVILKFKYISKNKMTPKKNRSGAYGHLPAAVSPGIRLLPITQALGNYKREDFSGDFRAFF